MMQQEFEKLTKVKVTSEEYNVIEAAYMACQEDKQVFCKQWLKKDGIRNLLKDRLAEIKSLNSTIKELEKKNRYPRGLETIHQVRHPLFRHFLSQSFRRL